MRTIDCKVELITPEKAQEYYNKSKGNRVINRRRVNDYIALMKKGLWMLNGESICFDWNGAFINGHHRMLAVIESGVSVEMLVVRNVDPQCWFTYDQGKLRSGGDVFHIDGIANANNVKAIVAKAEALHENKILCPGRNDQHTRKSNGELLEIYRQKEDLYQRALTIASRYQKEFKGLLSASYVGGVSAFLMRYKGYSENHVNTFWENFALGIMPYYRQVRTVLSVANNSRTVMQILYSAWTVYNNKKDKDTFEIIPGSFND